MFDLKITGATIIDGENNPSYVADIGITGDKIAAIGDLSKEEALLKFTATPIWL